MRTETDLLHGSIGDKLIRIALPLAAPRRTDIIGR